MIKKSLKSLAAIFLFAGVLYQTNSIHFGKQDYSNLEKAGEEEQISRIDYNYPPELYDKAIECVKTYGGEDTNNLERVRKLQKIGISAAYDFTSEKIDYPRLTIENLEDIIEAFE